MLTGAYGWPCIRSGSGVRDGKANGVDNNEFERVGPRLRECGGVRARGFTIVDLLTVILLSLAAAAVLLPLLRSATFTGPLYCPRATCKNLEDGAGNYGYDHDGLYPGQRHVRWVGSREGQYTGSQLLAACLFGYEDEGNLDNPFHKIDLDDPGATDKYAPYKEEYLATLDGRKNVLSDMFSTADTLFAQKDMAFCYYLSRKAPPDSPVTANLVEADNAAHTEGREAGNFAKWVTDERFGNKTPHNVGRFLLIAPGADRKYFSDDDIKNWPD